jgi:RNA polymerase sigma-70 factor (ECF subfamily)
MQEDQIQSLVLQAQRGDAEAFGQIYDELVRPIYNFLFSKLRHKQMAEDLTHTVFLKAWTNLRSYKPQKNAKFSTWLFQIANFTLIDHWRTRKETAELSGVENLSQFAQNPRLYEEYKYLWDAVAKLPLSYQTVLDLRFKQELTVEETAQIMKKSAVGVRVLQHRALQALKAQLKNIQ